MCLDESAPAEHQSVSPAGELLGSIESLVEKVWVNETIPHHEGMHIVTLVEHAVAPAGAKEAHFKIEIIAQVKHYAYLGSLPIKMIGVRDEQEKWISTKHITTQEMDGVAIINGTAPGWIELPTAKDLSVKTNMTLKVYDAIAPEGLEDTRL